MIPIFSLQIKIQQLLKRWRSSVIHVLVNTHLVLLHQRSHFRYLWFMWYTLLLQSIVELCSQVAFENLQFLPYILVKLCIACARISCYVIKFIIKFYIVLTLDNYISSSLITDHACKLIPAER